METLTQFAEAFGWTLLHSLWQGALVAAVLVLIMNIARPKQAEHRYGITLAALFLILGWSGLTFWQTFQNLDRSSSELSLSTQQETHYWVENRSLENESSCSCPEKEEKQIFATGSEPSILSGFLASSKPYMPWLTWLWMLGFAFFSLKWIFGYLYMQKIRFRHSQPMEFEWQNRLNKIARQVGIRQTLLLLESSKIHTPMVMGHLKPVILFPLGMIAGMTPKQVEAVLAHELAHIIRHDFLINMAQTLIESIFFYHPAVWWISSRVREEREHCCDDIAVEVIQDKRNYAEALTLVATHHVHSNQIAIAMQGNKKHLLNRIKRLFQTDMEPGKLSGRAIFGLMVLLGFSGLAWVSPETAVQFSPQNWAQQFQTPTPVLPEWINNIPEANPESHENRRSFFQNVNPIELEGFDLGIALNDTPPPMPTPPRIDMGSLPPIPAAPIPPIPPMHIKIDTSMTEEEIDEMVEQYEDRIEKWQEEHEEEWNAYGKEMEEWGEEWSERWENEYAEKMEEWGQQMEEWGRKFGEELEPQNIESALRLAEEGLIVQESILREQEKALRQVEKQLREQEIERRINQEEIIRETESELRRQQLELEREVQEELREAQRELRRSQMELKAEQENLQEIQEQNLSLSDVIEKELIRDGLIDRDDNKLEIKLDAEKMKVNGQKVSEDLHRKYLQIAKEMGKDLSQGGNFHFQMYR